MRPRLRRAIGRLEPLDTFVTTSWIRLPISAVECRGRARRGLHGRWRETIGNKGGGSSVDADWISPRRRNLLRMVWMACSFVVLDLFGLRC